MSRSALNSHDRESFIKSQILACNKALNKAEAPLKQKHARALIVGTHKERSATVFWNTISHIALEKNPIVTWKFCHLLHKLIRDGHRNVASDSYRFKNRIVQLGNFWQHLRTSGYGSANFSYCNALVKRLEFHHRYSSIPGSFELTPPQIGVLAQDVNEAFELAIELLDQLDSLLELKNSVTSTMDSLRWSSLILQGQCLLAPLVLVIIDTSKIYDLTVKLLFKLHAELPADVLAGHRSRFNVAYRGLKKFYDDAAGLQYFQYLVSITTLPADPPNFLNAHGLDTYQTPQAYLHNEGSSEGGDTPPDNRSMVDETLLVDLDFNQPVSTPVMPTRDQKDVQIEELLAEKFELVQSRERLMNEAKARINEYENSLQNLAADRDYWKERALELEEENKRLREALEKAQQSALGDEDLKKSLAEKEEMYQKLKAAYGTFRTEHLQALRDIGDLNKRIKDFDDERERYEKELRSLKQQLAETEEMLQATRAVTSTDIDAEQLGAELESEMDRVHNAIFDAVRILEELQKKSKENATGVRLQVNDKILESCNDLINAIKVLVLRSKDVQEEIVQQGRGNDSPREFYKKNHHWTEGLLSAAKAVGGAATYLVQCADGVVTKNGKFENLIIAAQEVAASVAQLYVSSRVKADKDSKKMAELGTASKTVNKCTAGVVATVKSGQLDLAGSSLDFSNLSLHEAKKQEMESQVRTLELEAELEKERIRLADLRKKHYHLASLVSQENGQS